MLSEQLSYSPPNKSMPTKAFTSLLTSVTAAAFALSANAATILINEDFNTPEGGATDGTSLTGDTTNFPEWNWNDADGFQYGVGPNGDGVPVSAGDGYVKVDSFGSFGDTNHGQYDTGHTWSSTDQFTLSLNATEQNWGSENQRLMVVAIKETSRTGTELTGATLWTETVELVLDPNHDSAGEGWGPNNTFSWTFNASNFTTGTEGTAISFEISGDLSSSRGYYYDNVLLTVDPIPEPSAALLGGLGMLLMLRRRR